MKRTTKAIFIFLAVCLVLSIATAIFGLYNLPSKPKYKEIPEYSDKL